MYIETFVTLMATCHKHIMRVLYAKPTYYYILYKNGIYIIYQNCYIRRQYSGGYMDLNSNMHTFTDCKLKLMQ